MTNIDPEFEQRWSQIQREQSRLTETYEKYVKPSRWIYCKYCYGNRRPIIDWYDGLVKCGTCDYGLWPLQDDFNIRLWIIGKWYDYISLKFMLHNAEYDLKKRDFEKCPEEELIKGIDNLKAEIEQIARTANDWKPRK